MTAERPEKEDWPEASVPVERWGVIDARETTTGAVNDVPTAIRWHRSAVVLTTADADITEGKA